MASYAELHGRRRAGVLGAEPQQTVGDEQPLLSSSR